MQEHYKGKKKLGYGREKICLLIGASKSITMKKKKKLGYGREKICLLISANRIQPKIRSL
jgi:hypothetical protein